MEYKHFDYKAVGVFSQFLWVAHRVCARHVNSMEAYSLYNTRPPSSTPMGSGMKGAWPGRRRYGAPAITLDDLRASFHLPIHLAALQRGVCPTIIKRISRRYGIRRWPYRKIESLSQKLKKLEQQLRGNPLNRSYIRMELLRTREEMRAVTLNPNITLSSSRSRKRKQSTPSPVSFMGALKQQDGLNHYGPPLDSSCSNNASLDGEGDSVESGSVEDSTVPQISSLVDPRSSSTLVLPPLREVHRLPPLSSLLQCVDSLPSRISSSSSFPSLVGRPMGM